jgi:hypothetical protein
MFMIKELATVQNHVIVVLTQAVVQALFAHSAQILGIIALLSLNLVPTLPLHAWIGLLEAQP